MKAVGIICEYNPFHNGHIYHLKKVKENFKDYIIILVMSSSFMQRGETSLINKWDKTEIALFYGIDIVIELPFVFSTQSADIFARGAIYLLEEMGVSHIVFGSETNNINMLKEIANIQSKDTYNKEVKKHLESGINYPTALNKALLTFTENNIKNPNDLLALSYVKAIQELKSNIIPVSIQRTNNYHKLSQNTNITSASSIRELIKQKKDFSSYIPEKTKEKINNAFFIENYFPFLKYKILTEIDVLDKYQTVDEGIASRIRKYITSSNSLEELILNVKTKRYTYNKLSRMFTHILCNFTKEEANLFTYPTYIRILGFSEIGQKYLKERKNKTNIPIITKYGDKKDKMLQIEKRATSVYASILEEKEKQTLIEKEYKQKVIRKKC